MARFILIYTRAIGFVWMRMSPCPASSWNLGSSSLSQVKEARGLLIGRRLLSRLRCCATHFQQGPLKLPKFSSKVGDALRLLTWSCGSLWSLLAPSCCSPGGYFKPALCGCVRQLFTDKYLNVFVGSALHWFFFGQIWSGKYLQLYCSASWAVGGGWGRRRVRADLGLADTILPGCCDGWSGEAENLRDWQR